MQNHSQRLKQLYRQINSSNTQYISNDQLRQWFRLIMSDVNITEQNQFKKLKQKFQNHFDLWVQTYLKQVCNLQPENIKNPEFNQTECFNLLAWIVQKKTQTNDPQSNDVELEDNKQNMQHMSNSNADKSIKNNSKLTNKNNKSIRTENAQQQNTFPQNNHSKSLKKSQIQQRNLKTEHQQEQNQFSNINQSNKQIQQSNMQQIMLKAKSQKNSSFKLEQLQQKYKQYLQCIFQHYCKINYGTGQDITFDNIQKKITIMTLNKFMVFCKEFQINILLAASFVSESKQKSTKNSIRNLLIDTFKKNSQFYKEMSFQQFQKTLAKIGELAFTKMKQTQKPEEIVESPKLSYQFIKILKYMEISNGKEFKQKMTKLGINYMLKVNKQLQQKKIPFNYKFKYQPDQQNKKIQNQNLISNSVPNNKLPPKHNNSQRIRNKIPYNNNRQHQNQIQENQNKPNYHLDLASVNNKKQKDANSQMSQPNIKPMINRTNQNSRASNNDNMERKISSTKNLNMQKRTRGPGGVYTPIQPLAKVTIKKQSLEKIPNSHNVFANIEGYSNIHLAKKGLLKQIDGIPLNKNNHQPPINPRSKKGDFQLNNIVQQARNIVYYDNDSRSGRAMSNISESKPRSFYSRQPVSNQSNRIQRLDRQLEINQMQNILTKKSNIHNNVNGIQMRLKNSRLQPYNQLNGLLDLNDSDEDEYLQQHLRKQKQKNSEINSRIDKKIGQLNQKR